eukprot:5020396-Pleurochrysis_carterae.AAC.1
MSSPSLTSVYSFRTRSSSARICSDSCLHACRPVGIVRAVNLLTMFLIQITCRQLAQCEFIRDRPSSTTLYAVFACFCSESSVFGPSLFVQNTWTPTTVTVPVICCIAIVLFSNFGRERRYERRADLLAIRTGFICTLQLAHGRNMFHLHGFINEKFACDKAS